MMRNTNYALSYARYAYAYATRPTGRAPGRMRD